MHDNQNPAKCIHAKRYEARFRFGIRVFDRHMLVRDVGVAQVMRVLEPIWHDKTETASRVRGRIERILDWATARGYRTGLNPARWRGHMDTMLAAPGEVDQERAPTCSTP